MAEVLDPLLGNTITLTTITTTRDYAYTYDAVGNRQAETIQTTQTVTTTRTQGLVTITLSSVTTTKTATQRFAYDGATLWADLAEDNTLQMHYLRGDHPEQLWGRISADGTAGWYIQDKAGTVRRIADANGNIKDAYYLYHKDGQRRVVGNLSRADRWRNNAREYDDTTKFVHDGRGRYTDLTTGRPLAEDPDILKAGDTNPHRDRGYSPSKVNDVNVIGLTLNEWHADFVADYAGARTGTGNFPWEKWAERALQVVETVPAYGKGVFPRLTAQYQVSAWALNNLPFGMLSPSGEARLGDAFEEAGENCAEPDCDRICSQISTVRILAC